MTRKEQTADNQGKNSGQISPTKRRAKSTGQRTCGRRCNKPRGMSVQTVEKSSATKVTTKVITVSSETESEKSSTTSGTSAPSPKRLNQKKIPPATTSTSALTIPTRRSVCHSQSTMAKALGEPIPINTIDEAKSDK